MVLSQKRQELVISKIRLCAKRKPACMAKQSRVDGSRAKKLSWTGSFSMFSSINANSLKPSTEVSGTACQILGMTRNHEARAQWNSEGNRQEGVNIVHRPLQLTTHAGHTRSSTQLCIQYSILPSLQTFHTQNPKHYLSRATCREQYSCDAELQGRCHLIRLQFTTLGQRRHAPRYDRAQ
jgi:hypothetical protein